MYDYKTQTPIVGAKVTLQDFLTTYTDINGNFSIPNILISSGDSGVSSISKKIEVTANTYDALSETITISSGATINTDFRLTRRVGVVSGLVILESNPVQNARVLIDNNETTTNVNGYFSLDNIPVGMQTLKVYIGDVLRLSTMQNIAENLNELNINLDSSSGSLVEIAQIKGNIIDKKTGALLPDMVVGISGYPSVISGKTTSSNNSDSTLKGFYQISNIPVGERTVTVVDPTNEYYDYSQKVNLVSGQNILDIEITPKASTVNELTNLLGVVYDENKNFVPDVMVRLRLFDEILQTYQLFEVRTADDGWYSFSNIPQGKYILTIIDTNTPKVYSDYFENDVELMDETLFKNIGIASIASLTP